MEMDITLDVALFKDGTVMLDNCSYLEHTYESGTVEFTGKIDGRHKTFNPMETMEKAGLVTTEHDERMFPDYKATDKLYKAFTSTGLVLGYEDATNTQERLKGFIESVGVTQDQAFKNLKSAGVTAVADVYQLSHKKLKAIICKQLLTIFNNTDILKTLNKKRKF